MHEFEVQSMTCGHCVSMVTRAVKGLDSQAKVDVDLPTKKVRVETSEDRDTVAATLAEAGYATA
ncbi:MAG: heavy-metal-associated domain-containing protein [Variovorax sp.]|nr:heavy-metal-associated domain-containing protein [Variovorax sp.]|tara:strand:+ start:172 stop:363 length:192 start_codon:yes stop_codon:yes gene_type:complete